MIACVTQPPKRRTAEAAQGQDGCDLREHEEHQRRKDKEDDEQPPEIGSDARSGGDQETSGAKNELAPEGDQGRVRTHGVEGQ